MHFLRVTDIASGNDIAINLDGVAAFKTSPTTGETRVYLVGGQKNFDSTPDYVLLASFEDISAALETISIDVSGTYSP